MVAPITLPQVRIPLGWAVVQGQRVPVEIDQEWMLSLLRLVNRTGGVPGYDIGGLDIDQAFVDGAQAVVELKKEIADLRLQLELLAQPVAPKEDVYDSIFG